MLPRIVERKWWYFLLSAALIVPGVIFIAIGGLKPGIEFSSGTLLDIRFHHAPAVADVRDLLVANGHPEAVVQGAEGDRILVRASEMKPEEISSLQSRLETVVLGITVHGVTTVDRNPAPDQVEVAAAITHRRGAVGCMDHQARHTTA